MITTLEAYFRSARHLVGRKRELELVDRALTHVKAGTSVFLIEGQGGIGKTRLLTEIRQRCRETSEVLCTEVIDLYLGRYLQPARMLYALATQLEADAVRWGRSQPDFTHFYEAHEQFYATLGHDAEAQRTQLEQSFLECYTKLAAAHRLVVLIDTFEKLHPALVDAQEFDFRELGRLEQWVAHLLKRLPNTIVVLAGRPRPDQRRKLTEILGPILTPLTIEPFTLTETTEYIVTEFANLVPLEPKQIQLLHAISAGRPVVLAVALACAQQGIIDITALPPEFVYPANQAHLSDALVRLIVGDLYRQRPDLAQLLARAVYLRKGVRREMLAFLFAEEGEVVEPFELDQQLDELTAFVFVKRVDEDELILHDEMYELLLGKLADQQALSWWRLAVRFLDQQIATVYTQLQSTAAALPAPSSFASLQQQLQNLQIERMFYHMSINLRQGYQIYRELSTNAIEARDDDFDAQLQEELARFFDRDMAWGRLYRQRLLTSGLTWERIIYDEGIRWVYRRMLTPMPDGNAYSAAVALAEDVRERYRAIYDRSPLARCDLDAAQLQAEVYIAGRTSRGAQITHNYQVLVAELEAIISQLDPADPDAAYAKFILANAYNYWGYFERVQEHLQSAITKYKEALRLYRQLGPEVHSLHAVTLNNLGYAMGRQGDSERGLRCLDQSLALVEHAGVAYRIATTRNTQAHLYADLGRMDQALRCVQEARRLFARFESVRATALNANAEGRIRSRIAETMADPGQRNAEYARAVAAYRQAIKGFDQEGELVRQIEVRSALAKALRNWATNMPPGPAVTTRRNEAFALLTEANTLTNETTSRLIRCSILEAMAAICVDEKRYDEAITLLDETRLLLPTSLQDPMRYGESSETVELRLYWLRFAQIQWQYAAVAFGQAQYHDACVHLVHTFTGLLAFSPDAAPIERFRHLARHALITPGDPALIEALREPMHQAAAQSNTSISALSLVDRLLTQAIEDIDLFGA
ncbi:tetratricopeptide repeat protein [Candidatus Chloroploca asiatica]|uniref:Orc1-like AAA ATPase domain-containing protein n=1 Tax=Candidatus Chloroploca asiatica TaxID=1506545 RepID=A0A2H3L260_9CHLR|nr:tetratricopeptide repeat protein [Candidatus Chloroploca asiatica]PDV98817.1 hypothetical protein A9Q02_02475 [Candidatus Chloroploca asiatica]